MTVIEYFISGILCIFQNQMECHFFFQERWGMSLSSFPIQTTYTTASKMNGLGASWGEGERPKGKEKILLRFVLSLLVWPHIAASLISWLLNPLSPGPLQQPTGDTTPSLTPKGSLCHMKIKPQSH